MLSFALPKVWVVQIVCKILLAILLALLVGLKALGMTKAVSMGRNALNDENLVHGKPRRCYNYSEADLLVRWEDVEAHTSIALFEGKS